MRLPSFNVSEKYLTQVSKIYRLTAIAESIVILGEH